MNVTIIHTAGRIRCIDPGGNNVYWIRKDKARKIFLQVPGITKSLHPVESESLNISIAASIITVPAKLWINLFINRG